MDLWIDGLLGSETTVLRTVAATAFRVAGPFTGDPA